VRGLPITDEAIHDAWEKGDVIFCILSFWGICSLSILPIIWTFLPMGKSQHAVAALRRRDFFPNPAARVIISREMSQRPVAQHRHEFFEIAIVLAGTGVHVTGQFRHTLQAGDVLVINSRRTHGYEETENLALVNILIRSELLRRLGQGLREVPGYNALFALESARWRQQAYASYLRLAPTELQQVDEWISRTESEVQNGSKDGYLLAEAYLSLIVGTLARRYGQKDGQCFGFQPQPNVFQEFLVWLEKYVDKPLSVPEMARQAGMSERTFHRAFRGAIGVAPMAYLVNIRLRRAAEFLRKESHPRRITDVAELCGFEDSNYFSRCFRKFAGMSPKEFRCRNASTGRVP
jgi:AraC family L-rhamnose operon regulatory protein RhaS